MTNPSDCTNAYALPVTTNYGTCVHVGHGTKAVLLHARNFQEIACKLSLYIANLHQGDGLWSKSLGFKSEARMVADGPGSEDVTSLRGVTIGVGA